MMDALERVVRGAYDLGALGPAKRPGAFYAARGWRAWQGQTWALTPQGPMRTEDEDEDDGLYLQGNATRLVIAPGPDKSRLCGSFRSFRAGKSSLGPN